MTNGLCTCLQWFVDIYQSKLLIILVEVKLLYGFTLCKVNVIVIGSQHFKNINYKKYDYLLLSSLITGKHYVKFEYKS